MTATHAPAEAQLNTPTTIRAIIQDACDRHATAVYLQAGRPPFYRISGKLLPQEHFAILSIETFRQYLQEILSPQQLQHYLANRKLDADVRIHGFMKGRVNCGPTAQGTEAMSLNGIVLDGPSEEMQKRGTVYGMVEDAFKQRASDIHLQVGEPPRFRIQGKIVAQESYGKVTALQFNEFLEEVLTPKQQAQFQEDQELDTAILYEGLVRCRVNCAQSIMGGAMVLRLISLEVPTLEKLGLPPILGYLAEERQGLIIITGSVNSGKSTSLAAMLRHVNDSHARKIVTIEDPIEYVHTSNRSLFTQREVGMHTQEFKDALRAALRQDPDIILIGEMRDRDTVDTAIRASLTGHLVLGTLHTKGAVNAFKRLLNFYMPEEQETVRFQIVEALRAVIAQALVPTVRGGRTAALELMVNTDTIRDYLLKGCYDEIYQLMEEGVDNSQTLNQSLFDLHENGIINTTDALAASLAPEDLGYMLKNYTRRSSRSGLMTSDYVNRPPS
ncbi:MAG: PilT/PilU family type 4a pilus ATPase [Oscillatoriales cyanobacterium C42_A2020_001]|nr:PilT/PilU family type 4a pilus ATPase [Leptolyngbyaceae cyanobacterium C42_A2020_001]